MESMGWWESGCFWRYLVLPEAPEEARKWRHLPEA